MSDELKIIKEKIVENTTNTTLTNKIIKIGGIVIVLTFIAIAVFLFLQSRQPIPSVSVTEETTVEETKFVLKDISNDPRFDDKKFITFSKYYEDNKNIIVKFLPDNETFGSIQDKCVSRDSQANFTLKEICKSEPVLIKKISSSIQAELVMSEASPSFFLTQFRDISSNQLLTGSILRDGFDDFLYIDKQFILASSSCDECTTSYAYYNGLKWFEPYGSDFIQKQKENLLLGDADFIVLLSSNFIKLTESYGDFNGPDLMIKLRLSLLGPYEFLFDRTTLEFVDFGYNYSLKKQFDYLLGSVKIPEDKFTESQQAILRYINWLINEESFDPQKEFTFWSKYISFDEYFKIPYPDYWSARKSFLQHPYYSSEENFLIPAIELLPPDYETSGQSIYLSLFTSSPPNQSPNYVIWFNNSKGLSFEIIKAIHVLNHSSLFKYLNERVEEIRRERS